MPSMDPEVTPTLGEESRVHLIRTHWALAVCARCEHESVQAEHCDTVCPGCGRSLKRFALYQETIAAPASAREAVSA